MMTKTYKLIHLLILSALAIAMGACVPKATEKVAICGANEAFNVVSRSCYSILAPNKAPVADNISPPAFNEDVQSSITLSYSDVDLDLATSCAVTGLKNVEIPVGQTCTCNGVGVCSIVVKGTSDFFGAASFNYSVKAGSLVSNSAKATLTINPVNDAPTILPIANQTTVEDQPLAFPFTITDVDGPLDCASSVSKSTTIPAVLATTGIGITGTAPHCFATLSPVHNANLGLGIPTVTFTVTDSGGLTASTFFTFTVTADNDAPTITTISNPTNILEDTFTTINFTLGDVDNTLNCTSTYLSYSVASTGLLALTTTVTFGGTYPACTATITPGLDNYGTANIIITANDSVGGVTSSNAFVLTVTGVNDIPTMAYTAPPSINENNVTSPTFGVVDVVVDAGGSGLEKDQSFTMTAFSSNSTIVPNTACVNYTPGAGAPTSVPTVASYYFDTTNKKCYVSNLTTTIASWDLYPSLTVFPKCFDGSGVLNFYGTGTPLSIVNPTAANKFYLDTQNNICYKSTGSTSSTWVKATNLTLTDYYVAYVPIANQSGTITISLTLQDSGGVLNSGVDTATPSSFSLIVNYVDNDPYFISSIIKADTNEGGMVVAGPFKVDEDQGSSAAENGQDINISSITSDNPSVLSALTGISIFYDLNDNGVEDSGESRAIGAALDATGADSALHNFYLKLNPIAGIAGNSDITMTAFDGTHSTTSTFSLIVHPIAAIHGGWSNISAVGIKTDKNGSPVTASDIQCNYNKVSDANACDGNTTCTKSYSPNGTITPDAANVLFWDSGAKKCYRSIDTSKFHWQEIVTSCPVTRFSPTTLTTAITAGVTTSLTVGSTASFPAAGTIMIGTEKISYTGKTATTFTGIIRGASGTTPAAHNATVAISGENFIKDPINSLPTPVASAAEQYYYNASTKSCYKSLDTVGVYSWDATTYVPSKVTLAWNTFNITGSEAGVAVSTYGWNVYRREKGHDYDLINGFLKLNPADTMSIMGSATRTFTDKTAVAGKVYYYLVRPVDNTSRHLTISTAEIDSEVRILAPAENLSFVHRWMANQEICNSMHMTTSTTNKVDRQHNYRCPYKGPGESATIAPGYYDIEKDMLVDISENGCPYSPAPSCSSTSANGCVGMGTPNGVITGTAGEIYYDRSSGSCFVSTGGTIWKDFDSATTLVAGNLTNINKALNAPLVNISQAKSSALCSTRTTPANAVTSLNTYSANPQLPEKKEYIAYSAAPYLMGDPAITDMEQGFSLNSVSRCNSSSANGVDYAFTDSSIPSSSYMFSLPGSASSGIRSIFTGSVPLGINLSTETCSSRYGVQDVYGNVSEWVKDSMTCDSTTNVCASVAGTSLGNYDFETDTLATTVHYGFDMVTGPYNDANADSSTGSGDAFLTEWLFRDELFGAGKFSFPVGMPVYVDIGTNGSVIANSAAIPFLLDVGNTSGITSSQLHEDGIIVNGAAVTMITYAQAGSIVAFASAAKTTAINHYNNTTTTLADCITAGYDVSLVTFEHDVYIAAGAAKTSALAAKTAASNAFTAAVISQAAIQNDPYSEATVALIAQTKSLVATANSLAAIAKTNSDAEYSADALVVILNPSIITDSNAAHISGAQLVTDTTNTYNASTVPVSNSGSFAVGGSYLSGNLAGRYTSELIPSAVTREDVGFRCIIPVNSSDYFTDVGRHNYSY